MKTRLRKYSVLGLAAALLVTALLVTTCEGALVKPNATQFAQAVEGKRYVVLNIGESYGRTIMPETVFGDFTHFQIIFNTAPGGTEYLTSGTRNSDGTGGVGPIHTRTSATLNTPAWVLPVGAYNITVNAYFDDPTVVAITPVVATCTTAATVGTLTTSIDFPLEPIDTGSTPNGTFMWDLSYLGIGTPDFTSLDTAEFNIYDLTDTTFSTPVAGTTVDLTTDRTDITTGINLNPGYYYVQTELTLLQHQTVTVTEVLHIYQGMTSTYTRDFLALVQNEYTITFNAMETGVAGTSNVSNTLSVEFNNTIPVTAIPDISALTRSGYMLTDKWFREAAYTNEWIFSPSTPPDPAPSLVFGPRTLYAEWELASKTVPLNVTYTITDPGAGLTLDTVTFDLNNIWDLAETTIEITGWDTLVPGSPAGPPDSITWRLPGGLVETGHPLVLDNTHIGYFPPGTHQITVDIVIDSVTYSGIMQLTVTDTTGL